MHLSVHLSVSLFQNRESVRLTPKLTFKTPKCAIYHFLTRKPLAHFGNSQCEGGLSHGCGCGCGCGFLTGQTMSTSAINRLDHGAGRWRWR